MGRLKRLYDKSLEWLLDNPAKMYMLAALASIPPWIYLIKKLAERGISEKEILTRPEFYLPVLAQIGTLGLVSVLNATTIGEERTRLSDYKKVRSLEKLVKQQKTPKLAFTGTQKIGITLERQLRDWGLMPRQSAEEWQQKAQQKRDPGLAIDAARKYFDKEQYDKGLDCIRDAYDWLEGKRPRMTFLRRRAAPNLARALKATRLLHIRKPVVYMLNAASASIMNPGKAWYWGELGKKIADEYKSEIRKETYVLHALLATAQKRSDEKQAWKEAAEVIREEPEWERLGESRTIVRVLKNSKFFASTFIFKEYNSLEALQREKEAIKTLEEKLPGSILPRILHSDEEPHEGRYAMVIRYIPGKTLYETLKEGKEMSMMVADALAEIHAKMPKKEKCLDIKWNLKTKLRSKDLGIPLERAKKIVHNYRPVLEAIKEGAVWVYNKDAHPENWIISDTKIAAIDFEGKELVPAQFDLANLLEYERFFTRKQTRSYINRYIQIARLEGLEIPNEDDFMRGYYNSVIHRMLSLSAAWSTPTRSNMRAKRRQALARALYAIKRIKEEHQEYYLQHEKEYKTLRKELASLVSKPASS